MSLIVKSLSYIHPDKEVLFTNISFSLTKGQKVLLWLGTMVLENLFYWELQRGTPVGGWNYLFGETVLCTSTFSQYDDYNIAEALGVEPKLKSLYAILKGDTSSDNFKLLDDDWNIEEKIK